MLVTEKPLQGELSLTGPDGSVAATSRKRHGGPPYFWFTEIKARRRAPGMRRSRSSRREQDAARSRARSRCARTNRAGRAPRRGAPGPCATPGIAQARTCSPPGSRSYSTIRSMRSRRGRRCTRWCAILRAISCSTISASTKTLKSIFVPTAPIFPTPCERTSRTRWGCPTASRSARAAAAARHPPAHNGSACRTPKRPSPRRHLRSRRPSHRP